VKARYSTALVTTLILALTANAPASPEVPSDVPATEGLEPFTTSVEILSPFPGDVVPEEPLRIAALFDPPLETPWDALVILDGRDVTAAAEITPNLFVLVTPGTPAVGTHSVTFSAMTATRVVEASWEFIVGRPSTPPAADATWPSGADTGELPSASPGWMFDGRIDVGWVAAFAETTAAESTDVFLPYEEVSLPSFDLYASGFRGATSLLLTTQYDPLYSERPEWLLSARAPAFDLDAGDIFPSLSPTTLEWASGLGGELTVRVGRSTTELVAVRLSEADTLAGFGTYSRFALGAREAFDWKERLGASLVALGIFDREQSVTEDQRLDEPLRNGVVAGALHAGRGAVVGDIEVARSSSDGEVDGSGNAVRARVGLEGDAENSVSLEYASCEPGYYSAGTYEYEPGESRAELEFAYGPNEALRTSGWVRVEWTEASDSSRAAGEAGFKALVRSDVSREFGAARVRAYVVARHDRTPYDDYDYRYSYAVLGGTWRRGPTSVFGSASWSRSCAPETTDVWSTSVDFRHELIARRWTVRTSARWAVASGDDDYTREQYTLESRWDLGPLDLEAEYRFIERGDRVDPGQSYTEHVVAVSVGRAF